MEQVTRRSQGILAGWQWTACGTTVGSNLFANGGQRIAAQVQLNLLTISNPPSLKSLNPCLTRRSAEHQATNPATLSSAGTKEECRKIANEREHNSFVFSELETREEAWIASGRETVWD